MAEPRAQTFTVGIGVGYVLVLLGVVAYVLSDFASLTALIPSVFGILFVGVGQFGRNLDRERQAVYGLGALSLLGIVGSSRGLGDALALVTGDAVESEIAAASQGLMVLLCLVVLVAVVRSVVAER